MKSFLILILSSFSMLSCQKNASKPLGISPVDPPVLAVDTVISNTSNFKGVNWADPRDNFVDNWLILSGLNVHDSEDSTMIKTDIILSAFQNAGANTIRLPINPSTVLQEYWTKYSSIIKEATTKKMKVILAYWEGASSKDGFVDDSASFTTMWGKVVAKFSNNQNVFFEVMNEPHGYSLDSLKLLYSQWIDRYPNIPRHRIILDGTGYATGVDSIGDDTRFDSCLLSFHFYTWFNDNYKTISDWEQPLKSLKYPQRTINTEFGVPMTDGSNYNDNANVNIQVAYLKGMTNELHQLGVGGVYWPGLRTGDSYSMFSFDGKKMIVNNDSGLRCLQYAWNEIVQ
ncbi:MAG TPA: cellulase family glycosylhydrolase [Arachidicoccus soli]|nr:cellulase family glycosylhydrolase [Arachidicoccus soli]